MWNWAATAWNATTNFVGNVVNVVTPWTNPMQVQRPWFAGNAGTTSVPTSSVPAGTSSSGGSSAIDISSSMPAIGNSTPQSSSDIPTLGGGQYELPGGPLDTPDPSPIPAATAPTEATPVASATYVDDTTKSPGYRQAQAEQGADVILNRDYSGNASAMARDLNDVFIASSSDTRAVVEGDKLTYRSLMDGGEVDSVDVVTAITTLAKSNNFSMDPLPAAIPDAPAGAAGGTDLVSRGLGSRDAATQLYATELARATAARDRLTEGSPAWIAKDETVSAYTQQLIGALQKGDVGPSALAQAMLPDLLGAKNAFEKAKTDGFFPAAKDAGYKDINGRSAARIQEDIDSYNTRVTQLEVAIANGDDLTAARLAPQLDSERIQINKDIRDAGAIEYSANLLWRRTPDGDTNEFNWAALGNIVVFAAPFVTFGVEQYLYDKRLADDRKYQEKIDARNHAWRTEDIKLQGGYQVAAAGAGVKTPTALPAGAAPPAFNAGTRSA